MSLTRTSTTKTVVLTDYYGKPHPPTGKLGCICCPQAWHRPYHGVLRDPETDENVSTKDLIEQTIAESGAVDGDELMITVSVQKTGKRPFGDRKVVLAKPHTYERQPA